MKKLLVITPCAPSGVPTQGSLIARKLALCGTLVTALPRASTGFGRLIEVLFKGLALTVQSDIIMVDVFGYRAFLYESLVIICSRLFKKRVVAVLRDGELPNLIAAWPRLAHFVLSKPDILVTPHEFLKDKLLRSGMCIDITIPNFIDLECYTYRRRDNLTPKFLYLRGLHSIYNPEMALRAFALIQKEYPDAMLTIAGPAMGNLNLCQDLVQELNLSNVQFLGVVPKSEIPELLDAHDIYIQTNRTDNMPVSLIEAWASGLPVVATNVGGVPYLIRDGVNGILVESEDHEAMAKRCTELIHNPERARVLAQNGRQQAQELGWENVSASWKKILDLEYG